MLASHAADGITKPVRKRKPKSGAKDPNKPIEKPKPKRGGGTSLNTRLKYKYVEQTLKKFGDVQKEVKFPDLMPTERQFRADFYLPDLKLIVEINGGEWSGGRHVRGKGYQDDLIKANLAQLNGFVYLQYTYSQVTNIEKDLREFSRLSALKQ